MRWAWLFPVALLVGPRLALACGACTDARMRVEEPGLLDLPRVLLGFFVASTALHVVRKIRGGAFRPKKTLFIAAIAVGIGGSLLLGGSGTGAMMFGGGLAAVAAIHRVFVVARLDQPTPFERGAAALAVALLIAGVATLVAGRGRRDDPEYLLRQLAGNEVGVGAAYEKLATLDGYGEALARRLEVVAGDMPSRTMEPAALALLWGTKGTATASVSVDALAASYAAAAPRDTAGARAALGWALGKRAPADLERIARKSESDRTLVAYALASLAEAGPVPSWACAPTADVDPARLHRRLPAPAGFESLLARFETKRRAECGAP